MNTYSQEIIDEINKIDIVQYISQFIELKKQGDIYSGVCIFHSDINASLIVYPDSNSYYCFGCHAGSSIIDFVMRKKKLSFSQAVEYLIEYSKFDLSQVKPEPITITFLKQYKQKNKPEAYSHIILPSDVMKQYEETPIFEWLDEGIQQEIMDKYQVRYNPKDNRVVFPIFDSNGNIIAVKGRTLYENFKELGLRKYTYYQKLGELDFLYGLCLNQDYIKDANEVICVEGEKSLWKLEGWDIKNVVSICTHNINPLQIQNLLKLHTNITIAFDKDIELKEIKEICKKLKLFTNVYVVLDTKNVLDIKDSPCDKGLETWKKLYDERIKI